MRKQWSRWELQRAENREIIGYFGGDFHNLYAVKCLNPKTSSLMQRFTVRRRTNDVLVDAPLWHPKRKLMAEIKKLAAEANERSRIVTKWIWDLSHLPADASPETRELAERCLEGLTGRI